MSLNFLSQISWQFHKYKITSYFIERILDPFLFKLIKPRLFFPDGYIGRDVSTFNMHLDYLLVNIVDLLRLYSLNQTFFRNTGETFINGDNQLLPTISNTLNLIESNSNFQTLINKNEIQLAWYAEMHFLYNRFSDTYTKAVMELRNSGLFIEGSFFNML